MRKNKAKKAIGIEIGSTKSSIGYEEALDIKQIPNPLGEEIIPSIVSIIDNNILTGIEAYNCRISNYNNTISEIKRIIGKYFYKDNLNFQKYKKNLSYELIEKEDKPILIKSKKEQYNPEEIYAYIVKKLIENGKKFIFRKRAVIAVPACFGILKRKLIKRAARLAGIAELQIINESSAAALSFEIYTNKLAKQFNFEYNYDIFSFVDENQSIKDEGSSPASLINNLNKLTLIFDLGGGKFDLTLFSIVRKDNKIIFDMKATLGDPNLGGIDFDNKLVEYCINDFIEKTEIKEEDIYKNKKSIQRLKIKCEIAKKILSKKENVIINVNDFMNKEDLCCNITREKFDKICDDLYMKIINKINKLFKITKLSLDDINEVLLIGGSSKIPKIKQILIDKFTRKKIIYYLKQDKIVISGVVLYDCEILRDRKNIILNEIVPFSLGIGVCNDDADSFFLHGDKMCKIIKKNSKLSTSVKKQFEIKINKKKVIELTFYEGDNKYVKYNQKLGDIKLEIPEAEVDSKVNFYLTFEIDINYILKIRLDVPSFKITKEIEIGKDEENEQTKLKRKLQINENQFEFLKTTKKNINDYAKQIGNYENNEDKNKLLINICNFYDNILDEYQKNYKEEIIENIYNSTKELFFYYLQRLQITNKEKDDNNEIISKIKERIKIFNGNGGYINNLLDIFKDLLFIGDKNIFFKIFINYMELMYKEGMNSLQKQNKTGKYNFRIYFESCSQAIKEIEINLSEVNEEEIKKKFEMFKNKINSLLN